MTKITIQGKEYILRYDMAVQEELEEKYENLREVFSSKASSKKGKEIMTDLFCMMANSANEFLDKPDRIRPSEIVLFTKHSSPGWAGTVTKAIMAAVVDGNRMQSADGEDTVVHDDYLKELEEQEKK